MICAYCIMYIPLVYIYCFRRLSCTVPALGLKTLPSCKSVFPILPCVCVRLEMVTAVMGVSLCCSGSSWITADSIQLQTHTHTVLEDRRPSETFGIRSVHYKDCDPLRTISITRLCQHNGAAVFVFGLVSLTEQK